MPGKNFFEEDDQTLDEAPDAPETIKVGEKEYSQDDLSRLVGLGEIAAEAEDKFKTKIDRVWPEYTKATQKLSDYERKIQELEEKVNQPAQTTQNQQFGLTEEQKAEARRQLEDLGFGQNQFRQIVREELAANQLLTDVDVILDDAKDQGNPTTTPQELLNFMAQEGVKNPARAYKLMFEQELDQIKEQKLASIKPSGMITTNSSTAGGKTPPPARAPRNSEELRNAVNSMLAGE